MLFLMCIFELRKHGTFTHFRDVNYSLTYPIPYFDMVYPNVLSRMSMTLKNE